MPLRRAAISAALLLAVAPVPTPGAAAGETSGAPRGAPRADGPESVLVVFDDLIPDRDGNGRSDDRDVAEYYARRRAIPEENLLALQINSPGAVDYVTCYDKILKPVHEKLASRATDGRTFSDRILFIALAPGVPVRLNTGHTAREHPVRTGFSGAGRRSVDQWLISLDANVAAGVERDSSRPGRVKDLKLGEAVIGYQPLAKARIGALAIDCIEVDGRPLAAIPVEEDCVLGEMVVGGRKLGSIRVGLGQPLGELQVGTPGEPLKLGDVDVRVPACGSLLRDVTLPVLGRLAKAGPGFAELRAAEPALAGCYLVTRLGTDPASARRCVDGALYAERYLRGRHEGGGAPAVPEPAIWLDQKFRFARDQVAAQVRCTAMVHAWEKGIFRPGAPGPLSPWKLVIDNQLPEIGLRGKDGAGTHLPTATAKVSATAPGNVLTLERIRFADRDVPSAAYFCPGWELRLKGREGQTDPRATISEVRPGDNQLVLSSAEGFEPGAEVISRWGGTYPATDCFYFYGFYGLGRYEDVFAFPPGAIGIHVDSSCMTWARRSLGRGIAATYGVVVEPFSAGIPYGDRVLAALARGRNLAEAMTGAILLSQRWAGVIFGDPLYAPFRGEKLADETPPVIAEVTAASEKSGVRITARLGGRTPDELADVALFRVEYGPDAEYGRALDFYDWPDPENPGKVEGRNYTGYAREFSRVIPGLEKGTVCHYRVVARDPAGNRSAGPDAVFTWE